MSLVPVKMLWPIRLDPGGFKAFTVEDELKTAKFVFFPLLRMYNTSGADLNLKIEHTLDLGFGDDPLYSGTWTFEVVNEDVPSPPNTLRDYNFTPQIDLDELAVTRHTVTVTNLDLANERICRFILFGMTEISVQLPASQQIIHAAPQ